MNAYGAAREAETDEVRSDRARRVRAAMPPGGLFAGKDWRVAAEPFRLPAELDGELEKLGFRLRKFAEACNLLYRLSVSESGPRGSRSCSTGANPGAG